MLVGLDCTTVGRARVTVGSGVLVGANVEVAPAWGCWVATPDVAVAAGSGVSAIRVLVAADTAVALATVPLGKFAFAFGVPLVVLTATMGERDSLLSFNASTNPIDKSATSTAKTPQKSGRRITGCSTGLFNACSSAFTNAPALAKRLAGSFLSARMTTSATAWGTCELTLRKSGGASCICMRATTTSLSASKGTRPLRA